MTILYIEDPDKPQNFELCYLTKTLISISVYLSKRLCFELKTVPVPSSYDLVVQDAFAVGLDLPCSEAGLAVD